MGNRVEHMQVWELEGNVQEMPLDQNLLHLVSVEPLSEALSGCDLCREREMQCEEVVVNPPLKSL